MSQQQPPPESFDQKSRPRPEPSELETLISWGQGMVAMLGALSRLAGAELQLALGDLKRLLAIGVLVIPVSVFAWLGVSALIGWWCYVASGSVSVGLLGFIASQGLVMAAAMIMLRRFSASIRLPHTRAQWRALMQDFSTRDFSSQGADGPGFDRPNVDGQGFDKQGFDKQDIQSGTQEKTQRD